MMEWRPEDVKTELVRAFRVLFSVTVRDSYYTAGGGFWPSYLYEADEVDEARRQAVTENRRLKARNSFTPRDIRRMEAILLGEGRRKGWLVEFLHGNPAAKRCLARWAIWSAQYRNIKHECRQRSWAYSTFRKRRDLGAALLAEALNAARVEL
jgi:hypothetical protein